MPNTTDPMYVEPGAWLALAEEDAVLEKYIADQQAEIDRLQIALGKEANAIERERLRWQIQQAKDDLQFRREELAEKRKVTELGLATSPIDFVAYEMYKRHLQQVASKEREQARGQAPTAQAPSQLSSQLGGALDMPQPPGNYTPEQRAQAQAALDAARARGDRRTDWSLEGQLRQMFPSGAAAPSAAAPYGGPVGTPRTDAEIQAMIREMVGAGGGSLGVGAFDVAVPTTQAISREEGRAYSQDEMDVLSSFLRAGFQANGKKVSYDPADYWREVQEGWVPTMQKTGPTQYSY